MPLVPDPGYGLAAVLEPFAELDERPHVRPEMRVGVEQHPLFVRGEVHCAPGAEVQMGVGVDPVAILPAQADEIGLAERQVFQTDQIAIERLALEAGIVLIPAEGLGGVAGPGGLGERPARRQRQDQAEDGEPAFHLGQA